MLETGKPTVMVVDDHDDAREMMRVMLERRGYRVLEAGDGRAALATASAGRPDLILMDLSLPVLGGLDAARLIRANASLRDVPLVAVTGYDRADFYQEARGAGYDEYLTKPFVFAEVEAILRRLCPPPALA
jgi:CheY-like chemotaxis protein